MVFRFFDFSTQLAFYLSQRPLVQYILYIRNINHNLADKGLGGSLSW